MLRVWLGEFPGEFLISTLLASSLSPPIHWCTVSQNIIHVLIRSGQRDPLPPLKEQLVRCSAVSIDCHQDPGGSSLICTIRMPFLWTCHIIQEWNPLARRDILGYGWTSKGQQILDNSNLIILVYIRDIFGNIPLSFYILIHLWEWLIGQTVVVHYSVFISWSNSWPWLLGAFLLGE